MMKDVDNNGEVYHVPALLEESVKLLITSPKGTYIDVTFGGGGHSREILRHLESEGRLLSFDRDPDAYANRIDDPRFTFVHSNFRHLKNFLRYHHIETVDGILADLGVSFHHFDTAERGFTFRTDAPLDMRMNPHSPLTAAQIIAESDEERLTNIFREFTDLKNPRKVAAAIFKVSAEKPLDTTFALVAAVEGVLDPARQKKELAQVFQALRIATNREMEDLAIFLNSAEEVLKLEGRLAILTYHSIEDRMVKNFFKTGNVEGMEEKDLFGNGRSPWKLITRKPVEPSESEVDRNPRSRSAKLRVAEKINPEK